MCWSSDVFHKIFSYIITLHHLFYLIIVFLFSCFMCFLHESRVVGKMRNFTHTHPRRRHLFFIFFYYYIYTQLKLMFLQAFPHHISYTILHRAGFSCFLTMTTDHHFNILIFCNILKKSYVPFLSVRFFFQNWCQINNTLKIEYKNKYILHHHQTLWKFHVGRQSKGIKIYEKERRDKYFLSIFRCLFNVHSTQQYTQRETILVILQRTT